MRFLPNSRLIVFLAALAALAVITGSQAAAAPNTGSPNLSNPYFSVGKALYDSQDQAKSQQQAIQDLLANAILQAIGKYVGPSQIGAQYSSIQKRVLVHAQKYVDSYQVISELQADGLYRVIGQVRISEDLLRKDLEEAGISVAAASRSATERPNLEPAGAGGREPTESTGTGAAEPVREAGADQPARSSGAARGLTVTKKEILWVVPEKWEQEWVLPSGAEDEQSLFAQFMKDELSDYDYTLQFPEAGSVKMDQTGNIPPSQVIALAQGLGIPNVVLGTFALRQERNRPARIETALRVLSADTGKARGEAGRELGMEEISNRDGAQEMAVRLAPQLNTILSGAPGGDEKTAPRENISQGGQDTPAAGKEPEVWTVSFPSSQHAWWREMEKVLREQFKSMRVSGLELGITEGTVRLQGLDGSFISRMNGSPLPSGTVVRIDSYSAEKGEIRLSFAPAGAQQPGPKP